MGILTKIFGTKSDREIKKILPIVKQVNEFYATLEGKDLSYLQDRTKELQTVIKESIAEQESKKNTSRSYVTGNEGALDRLNVIDRLIMQMSLCEMIHLKAYDISHKVTISSAIENAKKFSSEDSTSFVNGVLDSIYKEL